VHVVCTCFEARHEVEYLMESEALFEERATSAEASARDRVSERSGRPRVVILDSVHEVAVERLRRVCEVEVEVLPKPDRLLTLLADAHAVVLRSGVQLTADVFERAPRLKVVARAGTGTDNIDLEAARSAGVIVFNVPGRSSGAVAELAVGLMIAAMRNIALADRQLRAGRWEKPALAGDSLEGRMLGLVGCGGIGCRIAQGATALGMQVLAVVARPSPERHALMARRGIGLVDLETLLESSDVICLAVPLTEATRGMMGAEQFARMRSGSYLVNVARGGIVDEVALLDALRTHRLGGAALDVHTQEREASPFAVLDNVVLTPHIGAMSRDVQREIGETVARSVVTALRGQPVENRVC
jgi:D-3-phosphoglycerate dehydrogenase